MAIKLSGEDYTHLFDSTMAWGQDWKEQADRFDKGVTYDWKHAYWFELSYANFVLAREFLIQNGHSFQWTNDAAGGWVILTNYDWALGAS